MPAQPPFTVRVASPCTKDWDQMKGTAQKRFCEGCRQHVYDLSAMRYDEVRELLEQPAPPCIRFFRRTDGTVMTADCPVGKARARRKLRSAVAAVAAAWVAVVAFFRGWAFPAADECDVSPLMPIEATAVSAVLQPPDATAAPSEDWMAERRARVPGGERTGRLIMGRMRMGTIQVIRGASK